jgi:lipopolysaccharide biosynthesis glycosyltransferase
MDETVHIAIPSDDKYWRYAAVTAASAAKKCSLPICVHLIDGGVSDEHWKDFCDIVGCDCKKHPFEISKFPSWHGSGITWSRLWLPELLNDVDWVISADADILFRGDVSELWRQRSETISILPSKDSPLPGCAYNKKAVDWYVDQKLHFGQPCEYFCAGLSVINLRRLRCMEWSKRRDEFLSKYDFEKIPNADQGVLNYILQDEKRLLAKQWGAFSGDSNDEVDWMKSGAVHFVEDPPWHRYKVTHLASDLVEEWWNVAECAGIEIAGCGYHGCKNWLDWVWRRMAFLFLKHNQWIIRLHPKLWLHLRGTRGIRV